MCTIGLCVPRLRPAVHSAESWNVGTHHQILQRHVAPRKKSRKKRVHRKELCKSANLKSAILLPQNSQKEFATRKMRLQGSMEPGEKFNMLKNKDKNYVLLAYRSMGDFGTLRKSQKSENSWSILKRRCTL